MPVKPALHRDNVAKVAEAFGITPEAAKDKIARIIEAINFRTHQEAIDFLVKSADQTRRLHEREKRRA